MAKLWWIDGLPFYVQCPTFQKLKELSRVADLGEWRVWTRDIDNKNTEKAVFYFGESKHSALNSEINQSRFCFIPMFIPMTPDCKNVDKALSESLPPSEILQFGGIAQNGVQCEVQSGAMVYSKDTRYGGVRITNTPLAPSCRISVYNLAGYLIAMQPVLSNVTADDLNQMGFMPKVWSEARRQF